MLKQKKYLASVIFFLTFIFLTNNINAQPDLWATAYYAGWMQGQYNNGHLPAESIDYSAVTHIVHFSLVPNSDGTLNSGSNSITELNSSALISRAHTDGVKVIICVGGWNSASGFRGATSATYLPTFVANLVSFITTRGYDGIDIDWEPLESSDATLYVAFITALRTALNAVQPTLLLTAATGGSDANILTQVDQYFDQVNIMTYDMSGAWPGWVTWHNSPVYDGGYVFPSTGGPVPSANRMVDNFIAAGVPANKIGIGIDFYGYVWNGGSGTPSGGVTEPRQQWTSAPYVTSNVAYYDIMDNYYQPSFYRWDDAPKAAYLNIDNSGSSNDKFISYDNETTVQAKFDYARSKGIGGLIVWELGGGYRSNMPVGQRDPLLQAVKNALGGGGGNINPPPAPLLASPNNGATNIPVNPTLSWNSSNGATSYRLQVSTSSSFSTTVVDQSGISSTAYSITGLSNSTVYYWRVNASNSAGTSGWSNVWSFTTSPGGGSSSDLIIYNDALQSPWRNNSWSATVSFNSTERIYSGTNSIKVTTSSWGALSIHYGLWGSQGVSPAQYQQLKFAVYASASSTMLTIYFENDQGQSFPHINYGTLPVNQWVVISLPMSQMDPNNQIINRISIQETSGATKAFFVDEIRILGTVLTVPSAPILVTPSNGATDVSITPTLSWNSSTGATSYRLQLSTTSSFTTTVVDQAGITSTSYNVTGLINNTTYYWRVNASNESGTSDWSSVFSFTTSAQSVSPGLVIYEESLLSPWINTSWSTTLTFNNTQLVYEGTYSIKVVQGSWGAIRLRSGAWGNPVNVNTSNYTSFDFAAYGGSSGIILGLYFSNDLNQSFPKVTNIQVPANQWTLISIPINQLNPNNRVVHSVNIENRTSVQKTYYIDNVRFMGTSNGSTLGKETTETEGSVETFTLQQNYPNPFNPSTNIEFTIPEQSEVSLKIYNVLGQEVATLISGILSAGSYKEMWDASSLPSGIYIYQLRAGSNVLIKKMNFVK